MCPEHCLDQNFLCFVFTALTCVILECFFFLLKPEFSWTSIIPFSVVFSCALTARVPSSLNEEDLPEQFE